MGRIKKRVEAVALASLLCVLTPDYTYAGPTSATYHDTVVSRGPLESMADVPAMTVEAWAELQSTGGSPEDIGAVRFQIISDASPSLTSEQRAEVRSQLATDYLDKPGVLASLSVSDFCLLIDACWETGVSNPLIGEAIQGRFGTAGYRQINKVEDIRVLLRALKYLTSDEARNAKTQLVEHIWNDLLTDKAYLREQDSWELFKLIQTTASQTTPQRGQQFAEFYIDYLFAGGSQTLRVGPVELLTAGRSLDVARKTLDGQSYPEYAKALAKTIEEGQTFGFKFTLDYRYLAAPLGTDESHRVIRDVLIDDDGLVRLEAGKVLSWAYHIAGQLDEWTSFLETEIAGTNGDAEALWLLARSHCEEVKYPSSSPLAGRRWVESALKRAESEETKLVCVRWLMERFESAKYYDQGSEFLSSMEDEFETAESKRMVTALTVHLDRARTSNDIYKQRKKERETRYRLSHRIQSLRDRIEQSKAMEKSEYEITKLQTMLNRAEQELAVLGR